MVDSKACANPHIARQIADGLLVRDVMLPSPKTLPADASAGDLRRLFVEGRVLVALLVDDDGAFVGAVEHDELSADIPDERPARELVSQGVESIAPKETAAEALSRLDERAGKRMVVLDADGRLRGLICLTADRSGFCQAA